MQMEKHKLESVALAASNTFNLKKKRNNKITEGFFFFLYHTEKGKAVLVPSLIWPGLGCSFLGIKIS